MGEEKMMKGRLIQILMYGWDYLEFPPVLPIFKEAGPRLAAPKLMNLVFGTHARAPVSPAHYDHSPR
jgi:hypothetical protein